MSCRPQIPQAGKACAAKLVVRLLLVRPESNPIDRSDSDQEAGASSSNSIGIWVLIASTSSECLDETAHAGSLVLAFAPRIHKNEKEKGWDQTSSHEYVSMAIYWRR